MRYYCLGGVVTKIHAKYKYKIQYKYIIIMIILNIIITMMIFLGDPGRPAAALVHGLQFVIFGKWTHF